MITFSKFRKLNIDTSSVGWIVSDSDVPYFCTPRGAKIIGTTGCDGVHFCTVRELGDTVFAVSPMNLPGNYVHPIARNFEELLRLLLACCDMNVIEQAWMWDEDQLAEQTDAVRNSTYFDETPLTAIRKKCRLEPLDDPFRYLYELQSTFHYGSIPFTREYYETVEERSEAAAWTPPAWKVTMEGDFFPKRGKSGKEIALGKTFSWNNVLWHIPSAYLCKGGIVIDVFAEIQPETYIRFREEADSAFANGCQTTANEEEWQQMNPVNVDFRPLITVNGSVLPNQRGCGAAWYPDTCREETDGEEIQAKYLAEHYGFDLSRIWVIRRCTFPSEFPIAEVTSLCLTMTSSPEIFPGIRLENPQIGDSYTFTHPVYGTEHMLSVTDCTDHEMKQKESESQEWIFPTHFRALQYTVTPGLPQNELSVCDCTRGDSPRRRETVPNADCEFCSAIAVIGSADGPAAIMIGTPQTADVHAACSSLYFNKPSTVTWKMRFRVKTAEDLTIQLR